VHTGLPAASCVVLAGSSFRIHFLLVLSSGDSPPRTRLASGDLFSLRTRASFGRGLESWYVPNPIYG